MERTNTITHVTFNNIFFLTLSKNVVKNFLQHLKNVIKYN